MAEKCPISIYSNNKIKSQSKMKHRHVADFSIHHPKFIGVACNQTQYFVL